METCYKRLKIRVSSVSNKAKIGEHFKYLKVLERRPNAITNDN